MNLTLYSDKTNDYLRCDDVIDYNNKLVEEMSDSLFRKANNEFDFIKTAYEFVRDNISHSADINEDSITYIASDVLKIGHGICFAKSHLLTALLRYKAVPAGFCYQKLILDDESEPVLVYHGLNGIYVDKYKKWIRLDARGNKKGINAQFSIETEKLVYSVRSYMGEVDECVVYPNPNENVLEKLRSNNTRTELWNNLPDILKYEK